MFHASRVPSCLRRPLTRSFPSFPSPAVHGESGRDGEGGIAAAPSTSGGGTASRFALAATTATAIAAATFGLSVVARDARAPLGGLGAVDASFFPDVAVVGGAGSAARALMKADWNANHAGGFEAVRVVPTLDVRAWPDGDYPLVRQLVDAELGASALKVPIVDLDDDKTQARVLTEAEANGEDVDAAAEKTSLSAQHLVAMLDAKSRDAPALVVADRDASISALGGAFAHAHVGRPEEFDSVLLSFLYKGPKTWDVLWCDKGAGGVAEAAAERPALTMRNEKWVGDYDVFRWTGENGMRGSGLYVVSQRFLRALPKRLKKNNLDFVDVASFLADACAEGGDAACFSYLERKNARSGAKMAALGAVDASKVAGRRTNISWRDTVVTVAPVKRPASLGALMVGGEHAGDAQTLDKHVAEALGRAAAPVISFDDEEDWNDLAKPKDLDAKSVKELVVKGRDAAKPKAASEKTRKTSKHKSRDEAPKASSKTPKKPSSKTADPDAKATKEVVSKGSDSKPKAVSEKTRKTSTASDEDAVKLAPKSSKSSSTSSQSASFASTLASSKRASSPPPPRTTSKRPSSTDSKQRASKDSSKDSAKDADVDVDSMLDWWSDLPSAKRGTGVEKARDKKRDDGATHASSRRENAASKDTLSDMLDDAASSLLSDANPRTAPVEEDSHRAAQTSTSTTASTSPETTIRPSPVLEREGDLLPDDPETLARRREASREASEGEERDMRASAQMTDAGADARAERGRWRDEKPITLHTISPEEALKYVSRVHHKEEVEAAEAAAELARQEAEQQSLREEEKRRASADASRSAEDESYLDAIGDAYDDIAGERDARRSWSAVGEREEDASAEKKKRSGDDATYDSRRDYDEPVSRDYDDYARSEVGVPEDDYDEDQLLVSALAELTGEAKPKTSKTAEKSAAATRTSRPPTLKKSPHSVDVHAKHARHAKHAARAAASPKQLASARRVASDRSTLGSDERSLSAETQEATPLVSLSRAERAAAAKAAEQRSATPAAPTERAAGGAWRSAFTETQTQVSYATRARSVFDGSSSAGVNGSGASGAYGQTVGGARAASLGAPRRAMDEAELAALVDAADAELDDFGPGAKPLARDSITA